MAQNKFDLFEINLLHRHLKTTFSSVSVYDEQFSMEYKIN